MSGNYYESLGGVAKDTNEIPASPAVDTTETSNMETIGEERDNTDVADSSIPMPPDEDSFEESSTDDSTEGDSDIKPDMIQVKIKKSLQKKVQEMRR